MRDYGIEMGELIAKETDSNPYQPAAVAQRIVEKLLATDNDLLQGYLLGHAASILREAITQRAASMRLMARRSATGARMKEITDAIADGTHFNLSQIREKWLNCSFELGDGQQHLLRTMGRDELLHVAGSYQERADQNATEAQFFRLLAAKVGDGTVGEVLSEEQIVAMRQGLAKFK